MELIVLLLATIGGLLGVILIEGEWRPWLVVILMGALVGLAGYGWQKWSRRLGREGRRRGRRRI